MMILISQNHHFAELLQYYYTLNDYRDNNDTGLGRWINLGGN